MDSMIATSQLGRIVFLFFPSPNGLIEPFRSYRKDGSRSWMVANRTMNMNIDMDVILRRMNDLYIIDYV